MRISRIPAALVFSSLLCVAPLAAEVTIQRGVDIFTTLADGKTYYDFARNPIPSGFFCEGSKAFTGRVALKGLPLATETPGQLWNSDTVIERLDDAVLNDKGMATTRIRFRALSLVSIAPVKTTCGDFHVYVSLGGRQRVTKMSIRRTEEGGGTFAAPLAVNARMTFVPVHPGQKASRNLELTGSFTFPATSKPWGLATAMSKRVGAARVDTNGDQTPDTLLPGTSNFLAGRSPQSVDKLGEGSCPCWQEICHVYTPDKDHCSYPSLPPNCPMMECMN